MALDLLQAAKMLRVSPATVRRWARQGRLGVRKPSGEFRFEEEELSQWARNQGLQLAQEHGRHPQCAQNLEEMPLCTALSRGAVLHDLPGDSAASVLTNLVEWIPLDENCNRQALLQQLQAREALASTALGAGVALPHPRTPSKDFVSESMVAIALLEQAVDWQALDQKPVHAVILLLSPNPQQHLQVLSRVSFLLRESRFVDALHKGASAEEIQNLLRELESQFGR